MPMRIIHARENANSFIINVHLDTSKMIDGQPDPSYVRDYQYSNKPPIGQTRPQYLTSIRNEIRLLAVSELTRMNPPVDNDVPIPGFEGTEL